MQIKIGKKYCEKMRGESSKMIAERDYDESK